MAETNTGKMEPFIIANSENKHVSMQRYLHVSETNLCHGDADAAIDCGHCVSRLLRHRTDDSETLVLRTASHVRSGL